MADKPEKQSPTNGHAAAERQSTAAHPDGDALAAGPPGKVRIHRPKLSLRYRTQTFATDL